MKLGKMRLIERRILQTMQRRRFRNKSIRRVLIHLLAFLLALTNKGRLWRKRPHHCVIPLRSVVASDEAPHPRHGCTRNLGEVVRFLISTYIVRFLP